MQRSINFFPLVLILIIAAAVAFSATWLILTSNTQKVTGFASGTATVSISSVVSFSMVQSSVDFGQLVQGGSNDTADEKPPPFQVRNDGNVLINISINANSFLFSGIGSGNNTNTFQFRADNVSTETNAFDWPTSIVTFTNFTNVAQKAIGSLNWTNTSDEAEIEIAINVPSNEPTGAKSADIIFTASQSS